MKKTILSLFCVLALCLGLLPTAALAAGEDTPDTLWVGETQITASGYWTTDANGKLSASDENKYNVYYDGNGTLTLNNANIQGGNDSQNPQPKDYGIYAAPTGNQSVSLTIKLIGSNTVKGHSGICVEASGGDSTLIIQSDGNDPKGSLEAIGSDWNGITISSESGNASLTINNASVVANSEKQSSHGVSIKSRSSTELSLTVNGGSLTAKGTYGIFYSSLSGTNPSTFLTVSDSALIKAIPSIYASVASIPAPKADSESGGIVFDGTEGTVYGSVTLEDNLTIGEGESLTIPNGTSLNTNGKLTVNGGTLNGTPSGDVTYKVTGVSLNKTAISLAVGSTETLIATITPGNATNKILTWTSGDEDVATVNNGVVTAVAEGTATITVKTQDGEKTASCTVTVTAPYIPPNPSYLISVSQAQGGKITANPAAAKQGDTVTLTVTPEDGYELADLTVTDFWGRDVALTEQADGTYTFTMPASQVEIEAAFTQAQLPFTDVSEADWFYDEVQYVVDKGLMIGVSDTEFAPGADLTRAMLWTILARMDGETITGSTWAQDARAWAMANGVSDGTDANRAVTREELVTMLWRYTGQPQGTGDLSGFADGDTVSGWAEEAMGWSVGAGLIQGDENGLTPTATAIRAQIAAVLMRFCEGVAG